MKCAITPPLLLTNLCMFVSCEDAMTYAIHASRDGQSVVTVRISPIAAVDKARLLERLEWRVHITNSAGHQFDSPDFERLLLITAHA
jgi:hypothetical protein